MVAGNKLIEGTYEWKRVKFEWIVDWFVDWMGWKLNGQEVRKFRWLGNSFVAVKLERRVDPHGQSLVTYKCALTYLLNCVFNKRGRLVCISIKEKIYKSNLSGCKARRANVRAYAPRPPHNFSGTQPRMSDECTQRSVSLGSKSIDLNCIRPRWNWALKCIALFRLYNLTRSDANALQTTRDLLFLPNYDSVNAVIAFLWPG